MKDTINVIDLFAGPGGLGEGFFSYEDSNGNYPFKGLISVEKDIHAHSTLTLRAFFRLLRKADIEIPNEYYQYVAGKKSSPASDVTAHIWEQAKRETLLLELGKDTASDKKLFTGIKNQLEKTTSNEPTVLIGGPPCQAYSLVGRARNKGNKDYKPEEDNRHFLYKEYLSIMEVFSPDIFIMENVKGMLSSQIDGGPVFEQIVRDLEGCSTGYTLYSLKTGNRFIAGVSNPRDFVLNSEDYGIPQNRHRVIVLGIKNNSNNIRDEVPALKKVDKIAVKEAIEDLPAIRSPLSNRGRRFNEDSAENWLRNLEAGINSLIKAANFEMKMVNTLKLNLKLIKSSRLFTASTAKYKKVKNASMYTEFVKDSPNTDITHHEARPHMDTDLLRYFFCATYREVYGKNARANDFPKYLAPKHKNWNSGKFVDRFKVQSLGSQSSTITSHISKDGHYFIHGSPYQCRSLTVREAARIQTFPDSYQFVGKRTNQFHQVGNAVPPLLANQIARVVNELFLLQAN
ncbi:DNA cytosine methyltransferase [Glaciecola sp. 2405UD65-10]|uniref:DNA cytosine methyltransferase n=1 Tax=Glaciecola sp. 2405UD65-10 TaxID=3397244 RepID=UPI003B58C031